MYRVLLAAWMIVTSNISSMTIVHAHAEGQTQHRHFGVSGESAAEQADPKKANVVRWCDRCSDSCCLTAHDWHAHVWLFGVEIHVPVPDDERDGSGEVEFMFEIREATEPRDSAGSSHGDGESWSAGSHGFSQDGVLHCSMAVARAIVHPRPLSLGQRLADLQTFRC